MSIVREATYETIDNKVEHRVALAKLMRTVLNERPPEEQHKECFYTIGLNSRNQLLFIDHTTTGTVNECPIYPREIFKSCLTNNATKVILCHNHPSGIMQFSKEDIDITKVIIEMGHHMEVAVVEHMVLGNNQFISMYEEGYIKDAV